MIESIEFSKGVLCISISLPSRPASCERNRSVEFDFGESGAVAELHRGELMDFLYSVGFEGAYEVGDLVFKLLSTHSRVRGVYFNCVYRSSESLESGAAPDEKVQLTGGAVESASSEEDIPF